MNNLISPVFKIITFIGAMSVMVQPVNAKEIMVQIENINREKPGNILVMLFGQEGFPKDHSKALAIQVLGNMRLSPVSSLRALKRSDVRQSTQWNDESFPS